MARTIKIKQPNETTYLYLANPTTTGITIEIDDFVGTVTLEYSKNGSTWTTIGTTAITTYDWEVDSVEYADIFLSGDTQLLTIRGTDATDSATVAITACKRSVLAASIKPNKESSAWTSDSDATFANHDIPIYYLDAVNILWSELYDSPTDSYDVYVVSSSNVETLLYSGIAKSEMNLSWVFGSYKLGGEDANNPLIAAGAGNFVYAIRIKGTGVHSGNFATGTYFAITTNAVPQDGMQDYRNRLDLFKRGAGEKAILVDEFPTLGQFEAGDGIRITQRNAEGRRVGDDGAADSALADPLAYEKAFNLVISADVTSVPRQKRAMSGWINPSNYVEFDPVLQLGAMFKVDLNHGWNLGVDSDPNYVDGQTQNHYQLHLIHVEGDGSFVQPEHEIRPMVDTKNANAITIYAVKKGGAYQPALAKDQVSVPLLDMWYHYTLEEVIPYPVS